MDYARDIKEIRTYYNLKAQELSKKARLNVTYITSIENQKNKIPRYSCLIEIATILNIERICRGESFSELEKRFTNNIMINAMKESNKTKRIAQ